MTNEIRELKVDELENVAGGTITWGTYVPKPGQDGGSNQGGGHK